MVMSNERASSVDHYFEKEEPAETLNLDAPISAPPMLNLRFHTGEEKAFPYSDLIWLDYNASKGILIHFASHTVAIWGKNLRPVYVRLVAFELAEIVEESEEHRVEESERPVVDKIRAWTKPTPTGDPWSQLPTERK
jgi:hypothetical protein